MQVTTPAYVIATVKAVNDRRGLEEYRPDTGPSFAGSGARHLAAYTPLKLLEGKGPLEAAVLIEFPDMDAADRWVRKAPSTRRQSSIGPALPRLREFLVDGGAVSAENRVFHSEKDARKS